MKLRIKGNSIRLRLTQTEVQHLVELGKLTETLKFGPTAFHQLNYTIQKSNEPNISATYNLNEIKVNLPESLMNDWANSNQISIRYTLNKNEDPVLLLIEKDFKCLNTRPQEDESDMYPHPNELELKC